MISILDSIKKMLGVDESNSHFDQDIIFAINTTFGILSQIGLGPDSFSILDSSVLWTDYMTDIQKLELVKSYVYLRSKMLFDPPTSSSLMTAYEKQLAELEWRITNYINEKKHESL